jgi:hypothetical protein
MAADARAFEARVAELEARRSTDPWGAVSGLRGTYEAWARAELGIAGGEIHEAVRAAVERGVASDVARAAEQHLAQAERCQWQIGTTATGSGEGLASMFEVYTLQLSRAWLLAACAAVDPACVDRARALAAGIERDPNGLGARLERELDALRAHLDALG